MFEAMACLAESPSPSAASDSVIRDRVPVMGSKGDSVAVYDEDAIAGFQLIKRWDMVAAHQKLHFLVSCPRTALTVAGAIACLLSGFAPAGFSQVAEFAGSLDPSSCCVADYGRDFGSGYVTLISVVEIDEQWTVDAWEASGC